MSGITIFYNEEFGYIIGSHTKQAKTDIPTTLDQVEILEPDTSIENLSKYMYKAIEKSFNNPIYNNEILPKYWTVSGIKSFSSFSKNFSSVKIIVDDGVCKCYKLMLATKSGGYKVDKNYYFECPKEFLYNETNKIKNWLLMVNENISKNGGFETADDSKVSYKLLPDEYIDIEDGHTDAYQIYTHEEYENNYIGFMIDTAYESFSSEDIKKIWTRWYGALKTFKYKEINNKEYYIEISGKTNKVEKHSYLFKDGEEVLELTFEIDLVNTPQDIQEKIKKDFKKFVKSVKVVKK
ncbi:hypothetical protein [Parvimonas micra]|uniref:hypothetical protein n=1 Tax=Parvimonas micra TaxID=33033 RepID=UPI002002A65C|nr:hypothetical protein [Parvimonas micra]MCK6130449.1 hypothetical protein [Parvimonas micra]MCK6136096.1 hypothetical protein [Parvimonas micra]MCK6137567.1 hypothetical protein [Parvimonas micra]MCK6154095.1 hypothetical protein [Parvimonas micra]